MLLRFGALAAVVVVLAPVLAVVWALLTLRGSLPDRDRAEAVPGLSAEVIVRWDERGVPVIRGERFEDVVAALGFAHAQDRFFQMDLTRRRSQGRLAELFGVRALDHDIEIRTLQLAGPLAAALDELSAEERSLVAAYTRGVNAGLRALDAAPFEYQLLRAEPEPWREIDCLAAQLSLMLTLSLDLAHDLEAALLSESLAPAVVSLLSARRTSLDSTLIETPPAELELPRLPPPGVVDWRESERIPRSQLWEVLGRRAPIDDEEPAGSNAWAVAGGHTPYGAGVLAGDMHLRLTLPATWYHAQLEWGGQRFGAASEMGSVAEVDDRPLRDAGRYVGLTFPGGLPLFTGGSTGHIAFAFTNLVADATDLVALDGVAEDGTTYAVADGAERIGTTVERIGVRGEEPHVLEVRTTRWGPIVGRDRAGRPLVLQWVGRFPAAIAGWPVEMLSARTTAAAVAALRASPGPPMNVVVADVDGPVGWTIMGSLPQRPHAVTGPVRTSAEPNAFWVYGRAELPPAVIRAGEGFVWSANHRALPESLWGVVGSQPIEPARARRINDLLQRAVDDGAALDETAMASMQLDAFAWRFAYIGELVPGALRDGGDADLRALADIFDAWDGTADIASPGYRMALLLGLVFEADLLGGLAMPAFADAEVDADAATDEHANDAIIDPAEIAFEVRSRDAIRQMLGQRPGHLIPPGFDSWDAYIRDAARYAVRIAREQSPSRGERAAWGDHQTLDVAHPLAASIPEWLSVVRRRLEFPRAPQGGDGGTIRAAGRRWGASNRLVVTPGHEEHGVLQLPGGQSGHPLSPNFQDRLDSWLNGDPNDSLLVGPPVKTQRLTPP